MSSDLARLYKKKKGLLEDAETKVRIAATQSKKELELASIAYHKIKKIDLKKEGFDPLRVADPLYVLLPDADGYTPLTSDVYDRIHKGAYRF